MGLVEVICPETPVEEPIREHRLYITVDVGGGGVVGEADNDRGIMVACGRGPPALGIADGEHNGVQFPHLVYT